MKSKAAAPSMPGPLRPERKNGTAESSRAEKCWNHPSVGGILALLAEAVLLAALMVMAGICAVGSIIGWVARKFLLARR